MNRYQLSWIYLLFFIIFCTLLNSVENKQDKYSFTSEYGELVYVNDHYGAANLSFFKLNRTVIANNLTIDLYRTVYKPMMRIRLFPFLSNEYRKGPIDFTMPLCNVFYNKPLAQFLDSSPMLKYSNLRSCPVTPGQYYAYNMVIDPSLMPPLVPEGRYKIILGFSEDGDLLGEVNWYVKFSYKLTE